MLILLQYYHAIVDFTFIWTQMILSYKKSDIVNGVSHDVYHEIKLIRLLRALIQRGNLISTVRSQMQYI